MHPFEFSYPQSSLNITKNLNIKGVRNVVVDRGEDWLERLPRN